MIIGICGNSGSGKSTLAKLITEKHPNALHVEVDKIGHKALLNERVKEELIKSFGEALLVDGNVDRKKLGDIVFNSRHEMQKLTDITWNYMQVELDKILEENKDKIVILDWILLSITRYFDMCDIKVLLDIPYEVRKQRAMLRDNISEEKFDLREKSSVSYERDRFDYVISENENEMMRKLVMEL